MAEPRLKTNAPYEIFLIGLALGYKKDEEKRLDEKEKRSGSKIPNWCKVSSAAKWLPDKSWIQRRSLSFLWCKCKFLQFSFKILNLFFFLQFNLNLQGMKMSDG